MTTIINAVASTGLTQTADGSGIIKVQSNGVTTNALAWVNFNGSTGTKNASYNVSSITKNTTGDYTLTFATAMTDANYAVCGFATSNDTNVGHQWGLVTSRLASEQTTTSLRITSAYSFNASQVDFPLVTVAIFGN